MIAFAPPRMSRASWLAVASSIATFGALAAACSSRSESEGDAVADAGLDVADAHLKVMECATAATGTFACGDELCHFPDQYCATERTNTCNYMGTDPSTESNVCTTKHVCSCASAERFLIGPPVYGDPPQTCTDIPGGGVRIVTDKTLFCGACYGAPPPRLRSMTAAT